MYWKGSTRCQSPDKMAGSVGPSLFQRCSANAGKKWQPTGKIDSQPTKRKENLSGKSSSWSSGSAGEEGVGTKLTKNIKLYASFTAFRGNLKEVRKKSINFWISFSLPATLRLTV